MDSDTDTESLFQDINYASTSYVEGLGSFMDTQCEYTPGQFCTRKAKLHSRVDVCVQKKQVVYGILYVKSVTSWEDTGDTENG